MPPLPAACRKPSMKNAWRLAALALPVLACATLIQATPAPASTPTSAWAPPVASPTQLPVPTSSTTPTLTPWPTFIILYSSPYPTATPQLEFDCRLNWQSPGNYITYKPKQSFTVGWKVTNTGRAVWYPDSVEFSYLAGARLHDDPLVRLPVSVAPGQSVILSVGMRTPKNPTMYTTRWSLRKDDTYFCAVSLSFYVK